MWVHWFVAYSISHSIYLYLTCEQLWVLNSPQRPAVCAVGSASLTKGCDCRLPVVTHMHFFMKEQLFCFFSFLWIRGHSNICVPTSPQNMNHSLFWSATMQRHLGWAFFTVTTVTPCAVNHKYSQTINTVYSVHSTVSWSVSQQKLSKSVQSSYYKLLFFWSWSTYIWAHHHLAVRQCRWSLNTPALYCISSTLLTVISLYYYRFRSLLL